MLSGADGETGMAEQQTASLRIPRSSQEGVQVLLTSDLTFHVWPPHSRYISVNLGVDLRRQITEPWAPRGPAATGLRTVCPGTSVVKVMLSLSWDRGPQEKQLLAACFSGIIASGFPSSWSHWDITERLSYQVCLSTCQKIRIELCQESMHRKSSFIFSCFKVKDEKG